MWKNKIGFPWILTGASTGKVSAVPDYADKYTGIRLVRESLKSAPEEKTDERRRQELP